MTARRNITLSLDEDVLRAARLVAASEGVSVSALIRRQMQVLVEERRGFARARQSALKRLARGRSLGGGPLPNRGDLHDRDELR